MKASNDESPDITDISNIFEKAMNISSRIKFEHTGYIDDEDISEDDQYTNDDNLWIFTITGADITISFTIYEKSVSYYTLTSIKKNISQNLSFYSTIIGKLVTIGEGSCLTYEKNNSLSVYKYVDSSTYVLDSESVEFNISKTTLSQMVNMMITEKIRLYSKYFYDYCNRGFYEVDINNELNSILPILESKGIVIDPERCKAMDNFERESLQGVTGRVKRMMEEKEDTE